MTTPTSNDCRISALIGLMDELAGAHADLLDAIEGRIKALRTADTEGIKRSIQRERSIVQHIDEREGLRRQLTRNIARGYGIAAATAQALTASQIAARIGGGDGDRIVEVKRRLRQLADLIGRRNQVAHLISGSVLRHIKHVFDSMTQAQRDWVGYSCHGTTFAAGDGGIFEAVG